ncbi:MAG: hypothetical protein R3220_02555 [Balneolaceae bacterium]|nr:hypothetical protein [Balneolaceae bacterium]
MNINVPSAEEVAKEKRKKRRSFLIGLIIGFIFFGLVSLRVFWLGSGEVEIYTWIALGFGVLSFGFFGRLLGSDFWKYLFRGYN